MIKALKLVSGLGLLMFSACSDFEDHKEKVSWGSANLSKFFAVGNSITAGYQSGSLFADGQSHSFAKQLADAAGTSFQANLISGNGYGERLIYNGVVANGSPVFTIGSSAGAAPTNMGYYTSTDNFNNLGVPGAALVIPAAIAPGDATDFFDVNVNSTGTDGLITTNGKSRKNPYFNVVLANGARGSNIFAALKASKPTFVSLWLGNNDVLGYATSGGTSPSAPTDPAVFSAKYQAVLDSILSLSTAPKVVVATIPNVVTIPFFTTVNPGVVASLSKNSISGIVFQKNTESLSQGTGSASLADLSSYKHMITLLGSSYAANIGKQNGAWVRYLAKSQGIPVDNLYLGVLAPAGIDTLQAFGLSPKNPWPNFLILDQDEVVVAVTALTQFNGAIKAIAGDASRSARVAVVDVNAEFGTIATATALGKSVSFQGIAITTKFFTGGLFSYDGVHPSDLGHGILANYFIGAINSKFGATIPEVDLNRLNGARYGKRVSDSGIDNVVVPVEPLMNAIKMLGGFSKEE